MADWQEPDPEVLDRLAQWGAMAADRVVLDAMLTGISAVPTPEGLAQAPTDAELTAIGVRAALRVLLANGLTQPVLDAAAGYVLLDPPPERKP